MYGSANFTPEMSAMWENQCLLCSDKKQMVLPDLRLQVQQQRGAGAMIDLSDPAVNPFFKEKTPEKIQKRICKKCGKEFSLAGDYDPKNEFHDLCDDCIMDLPLNPNQKYPDKTFQLESEVGEPLQQNDKGEGAPALLPQGDEK
jgi:hypothetical protein